MSTIEILKSQAKRLRSHFVINNIHLSHSQALEAVAAIHGHKDWNTASAMAPKTPHGASNTASPDLSVPLHAKASVTTICITVDMSIEAVRSEVEECMSSGHDSIRLRLDAASSGFQHREAYQVAREIEAQGVHVEVDSPLSL